MAASADPDPMIALAAGLAVFGLPPGEKAPEPGWHRRCTTDPDVVARTWRRGDKGVSQGTAETGNRLTGS